MRGTFKISLTMYMFISYIICILINFARAEDELYFKPLGGEETPMKKLKADLYITVETKNTQDIVDIKILYQSLCPYCMHFGRDQLKELIDRLAPYIDIHTNPYGNAQTYVRDDKVRFICQHGPIECYGNEMHACALNLISNHTEAIKFNICLMDPQFPSRGSDERTAIRCGEKMGIFVEPILVCAMGEQGGQLLKYYGDESKKINFKYVPYVLINGVAWDGNDLMKDVCAAFKNKPGPCLVQ